MKSKTKISNINGELSEDLLEIPEHFKEKCTDQEILEIINGFNTSSIVENQISFIHSLISFIQTPSTKDVELIKNILITLFVNANQRNAVKKTILRSIKKLQISKELSTVLMLLIQQVNTENNSSRHNDCINSINDCFNNFPDGLKAANLIIKDIYEYLINCLQHFIDCLRETCSPIDLQDFYKYIHNNTRALVSVSQQCDNIISIIPVYFKELLINCIKIFNIPDIFFDTKNNCGIILITALNYTEQEAYISMIQLSLKEIESTFDINYSDIKDNITIICIYAGILNSVDPKKICTYNTSFEESYIYKICDKLLNISKHSAEKPLIVLGVNRSLLLVSKSLKYLNENDFMKLLTHLLENVWTQLDHYNDTIRHISKAILTNFVKTAKSFQGKANDILSYIIDNIFKSLHSEKRAKYVAISVISSEVGCATLLKRKPNLLNLIISDLDTSSQTYIISCCENLMKQYLKEVDESIWFEEWVTPILKIINDATEMNSKETNLQTLLITALKLNPNILPLILKTLTNNPSKEINLSTILKCTIVARKIGICSKENNLEKWRNILDYQIIEKAKCDQNDEIRISCLSLIAESHKSTEIFNKFEFNFVISYLHYNISAQEPSTRQRILFLIKKILTRYSESYYAIIRDYKKLNETTETKNVFSEKLLDILKQQKTDYIHFVFNLRQSIFENLFSRSSFSRRFMCLEILTLLEPIIDDVLKDVQVPTLKLWKQEYANAILLCLEDSYEINQQVATKLLGKCPVEFLKIHDFESTKSFIKKTVRRVAMIQPALAQSAAYFFEISLQSPFLIKVLSEYLKIETNEEVYSKELILMKYLYVKLKEQVDFVNARSLLTAVKAPMYGILFCMRHLLEKYLLTINLNDSQWKELIEKIIEICFEISATVGPVVNNSSPEGHFPMDQQLLPKVIETNVSYEHFMSSDDFIEGNKEEEKGKIVNVVTPQMLLVCSWRSIKEVSLLLGDITLNLTIATETEDGLITQEQIYKIGEHFTVLLTETKHRGAFEQAYVGFAQLCTRLWKCKAETLHQLPVTWLNDMINEISNSDSTNRLCATRRSAGVPFLVQAILVSELQTSGTSNFHRCMHTFLQLANHPGDNVEIRTHSMNVLRALFRHSQFGEEIAQYTGEGLIVSIVGYSRKTWGERNSATLLFASLMTRIFGVQRNKDSDEINIRNKMTARVFFMRHPTLHSFLLSRIEKLTNHNCAPYKLIALYPILLLLARLYLANSEDQQTDNLLQVFVPYVKLCAKNKNFKTRELAAKALIPLISNNKKNDFLKELFKELHTSSGQRNYTHGILLQIYYLIPTISEFEKKFDICKIIKHTNWVLSFDNLYCCSVISILYMKIVSLLIPKSVKDFLAKTNKKAEKLKTFEDLSIKLISQDNFVQQNFVIGKSEYMRESTYLQLNLLRFRNYGTNDGSKISKFLIMKMMTQNDDVLEISLNFLLYYLNELKRTKSSIEFILDSLEIPDHEKQLAKLFAQDFVPDATCKHLVSKFGHKLHTIFDNICSNYQNLTNKAYIVMSYFKKLILKDGVEMAYKMYFSSLVKAVTSHNDEQVSAVLVCIKIIMKNTLSFEFVNDIGLLDHLFEILYECATPRRTVCCRYAVALTFSDELIARMFLERGHFNIGINNVIMVWKIIMQLSIDPDPMVRNKITELDKSRTIAEKSREILIEKCVNYFRHISTTKLIHLLLYWCISDLEQLSASDEIDGQVFEKGETSSYIEDMFISRLASQKLSNIVRCETLLDFHDVFARLINVLLMEQDLWDVEVDELITIFEDFQRAVEARSGPDLIQKMKTFVDSYYGLAMHSKIKYICLGVLPENFVWEE